LLLAREVPGTSFSRGSCDSFLSTSLSASDWSGAAAGQIEPSPETQFGFGPTRQGVFRGQPVYFKVIDGWAIAEGDIILGKAEDLEAALDGDRILTGKQLRQKSLTSTLYIFVNH